MNVAPTSAAPSAGLASLPAAGAGASGIPSFPALLAQLASLFSSLTSDTPSPAPASTNPAGSSLDPQAPPAPISDPLPESQAVNPIPVSPVLSNKAVPAAISITSAPLSRSLLSRAALPAALLSPAPKTPLSHQPTAALSLPAQPSAGDSTPVPVPSAPPPPQVAAGAEAPSLVADSNPAPPSASLAKAFLASLQPAPPNGTFPSESGAEPGKPTDQAPAQIPDPQAPANSTLRPLAEQKAPPELGKTSRTGDAKSAPAWVTVPVTPPRPVIPLSIEVVSPPVTEVADSEPSITGPRNAGHRPGASLTDAPQPTDGTPTASPMMAEATGFDLFWRTFGSSSTVVSNAAVSTGNHIPPVAPLSTPDVPAFAAAPVQDEPAVPQTQKPGPSESGSTQNEPLAESAANAKSPAPVVPNAAPAGQNQGDDQPSGRDTGHENPQPSPHAPPAFVVGAAESSHPSEMPAGGQSAEHASAAPQAQPSPAESAATANPRSARELSLRLEQDNAPAVSLSLSERGGAVHVAVRTSDTDLGSRLQSNLDQLMVSLRHQGVEAEAGKTAPLAAQRNQPGAGDQNPFDSQGRPGNNGSGNRQRQRRNRTSQPAEGAGLPFRFQIENRLKE